MSETGCRTVAEAILRDLLIEALPYVDAGQDEPEHDAAGKARARNLAARIRATVEGMKVGAA